MYVLLEHREIVAYALDVEGEGGVVTGARRDRCAAECRHAQASSPGRPASQWPMEAISAGQMPWAAMLCTLSARQASISMADRKSAEKGQRWSVRVDLGG